MQKSELIYPHLPDTEIFASLERFYRRFYFRPRTMTTMAAEMLGADEALPAARVASSSAYSPAAARAEPDPRPRRYFSSSVNCVRTLRRASSAATEFPSTAAPLPRQAEIAWGEGCGPRMLATSESTWRRCRRS